METSTSRPTRLSPAAIAAREAVRELAARSPAGEQVLERALGTADILGALGVDEDLACGALAAAVLEAGLADQEEATRRFGPEAVRLARGLAELGSFGTLWSPQNPLSPAQTETLRKMLLAVVADPRLILLKLAERLDALRRARDLPEEEQRRLALEAREIYAPLANRLGVGQLKWELEDLALRYLEPDTYRTIATALNARRVDRERYVQDACAQLQAALKQAGIEAEVSGRAKSISSIWRKMQRKQLPFEQIYDTHALRVMVDSVADCYAALGVVHGLWPYIETEFDDYIVTPKHNRYRSLHTAVHGPGGRPLEIQIRTREMHEQAELGVAAHWKYKENVRHDAQYETKIRQVRQLLAPAARQDADADYLERVRAGLFSDRVYALTPKGDVIELPRGATPLDFAYHVHTGLGHRCRGAKVNGRIVPLTYKLSNGEVVEILTGKEAQPNRDWLNASLGYLASSRSRAKVRAYFRKLDAVATPEPASQTSTTVRLPAPPRRVRTVGEKPRDVVIEGIGDLSSSLARCCNPQAGDPIVGYITVARGVSVHRKDCASFIRMQTQRPERVLDVEWR